MIDWSIRYGSVSSNSTNEDEEDGEEEEEEKERLEILRMRKIHKKVNFSRNLSFFLDVHENIRFLSVPSKPLLILFQLLIVALSVSSFTLYNIKQKQKKVCGFQAKPNS